VELRTVDVHIRRLRKGLDPEANLPEMIRTVRSAGYALEEGTAPPAPETPA
jgi:two-component system phosphate regulon response regulator PhoB